MKAAVFTGLEKKIKIVDDYPKPVPNENEVLIKIKYCGICGSDLSNYLYQLYNIPLIMGHEFSGTIEEIGSNVKDLKVGDPVTSYCSTRAFKNFESFGIFTDGAFAEYMKIKPDDIILKPEAVTFEQLCLSEPVSCAIHAVNISSIGENEGVIILGSGIIGLSLLQVLNALKSPKYIIMVDFNPALLEKAKELGATACYKPNEKIKIKRFMKKNRSCSYVFDCAGSESSYCLSLELVKPGGTVLLEGIKRGNIPLPISMIVINELTVKGSYAENREEFLEAIELIRDKKINSDAMISEIVPLDNISYAFERMNSKDRSEVKFLVNLS